ncbi:MAG: HAD domain-containing protein [Candidatus Dormibacteria bacterium]
MKVLFLDFDGVLNSNVWFKANKDAILAQTTFLARDAAEIDPIALARVRRVVELTGAQIVVSSSWRIGNPIDRLREIIKEAGWPDAPIIGVTPWPRNTTFRGDEVALWLKQHPKVTKFVCLDDDGDFHPDQSLVQTSWDDGIQECHVERMIELLNG